MRKFRSLRRILVIGFVPFAVTSAAFGWGSKGHRIINRVAIEMLPANLPAFMRNSRAIKEIEFLGPEPDRWRAEADLNSAQAPEHFIDLELADAAAPGGLPARRFDFIRDVYAAAVSHREMAAEFTPQKIGLLPWAANEWFGRLEIDMRDYRIRRASGRNTFAIGQAILYEAGILGHYVADGSQPLHTTINYDGWIQKNNPERFTRRRGIHRQFETEFVDANVREGNILPLVPAAPRVLSSPFQDFIAYLRATHGQVGALYRLQKRGGFDGGGSVQSRNFTAQRLAAGATMLRDMIVTAWAQSAHPR